MSGIKNTLGETNGRVDIEEENIINLNLAISTIQSQI